MDIMTLSAAEISTLLMLSVAVLDVINSNIKNDTIEELKVLQSELDGILFKEKSPLNPLIIPLDKV